MWAGPLSRPEAARLRFAHAADTGAAAVRALPAEADSRAAGRARHAAEAHIAAEAVQRPATFAVEPGRAAIAAMRAGLLPDQPMQGAKAGPQVPLPALPPRAPRKKGSPFSKEARRVRIAGKSN
jgi:hypothetical protein